VNPNTPTTSGITPLEVAIDNKCSDAVHVLLEYGGQCHPSKLRAESRPSRRPLVSAVAKMWGMCTHVIQHLCITGLLACGMSHVSHAVSTSHQLFWAVIVLL
jgi:ankyrin repeat protein